MTYRNEGLVPLIPQLPSALAILLEKYHQEKDDYLALHRLCGILEFTARFLAAVLLAELWQRRHQRLSVPPLSGEGAKVGPS